MSIRFKAPQRLSQPPVATVEHRQCCPQAPKRGRGVPASTSHNLELTVINPNLVRLVLIRRLAKCVPCHRECPLCLDGIASNRVQPRNRSPSSAQPRWGNVSCGQPRRSGGLLRQPPCHPDAAGEQDTQGRFPLGRSLRPPRLRDDSFGRACATADDRPRRRRPSQPAGPAPEERRAVPFAPSPSSCSGPGEPGPAGFLGYAARPQSG